MSGAWSKKNICAAGYDMGHGDRCKVCRATADESCGRIYEVINALLAALKDMLAGWQYIREHHGDLYGVGWDRCEEAARAAIAAAEGEQS